MNKNKLKTHANLGESDGNGNDDVPIDSLFASGRTEVPKTIGNNSSFLQKSIPPNNNRGCAACPTLSLAAATAGPVCMSSTSPAMGFPQQTQQQQALLHVFAQMQQNALTAATASPVGISSASPAMGFPQQTQQQQALLHVFAQMQQNALTAATASPVGISSASPAVGFPQQTQQQQALLHVFAQMQQNALTAATASPVGISSASPAMGFPQQTQQQQALLHVFAQMQQNALTAATAGQLAVGSTASPLASLHAPNKRLQPIKASAASSRKGKRDDQKEEEAAKVYHEYRTLTDEERITLLGGEARGLPGIMQKVGFDDECCKDKATQRRVRRREEKMRKEGKLSADTMLFPPPNDPELIQQYSAMCEACVKYFLSKDRSKAIRLGSNNTFQLLAEDEKDNTAFLSLRDLYDDKKLFLEPAKLKKKLKAHALACDPEMADWNIDNVSLLVSQNSRGGATHIDAQHQRRGPNERVFFIYLTPNFPGTARYRFKDIKPIVEAEDLERIWPDAPNDLVSRIKGVADAEAEDFIRDYGAVFHADLGEEIETKEAEQFSMMMLDASQPHFTPSTLGNMEVRVVLFFTMTPPNFVGKKYSGDTQMSREKLCLCLYEMIRKNLHYTKIKDDECCAYLRKKFLQYTKESAARGARDESIEFRAGDQKNAMSALESLIENTDKTKEIEASLMKCLLPNIRRKKRKRY